MPNDQTVHELQKWHDNTLNKLILVLICKYSAYENQFEVDSTERIKKQGQGIEGSTDNRLTTSTDWLI